MNCWPFFKLYTEYTDLHILPIYTSLLNIRILPTKQLLYTCSYTAFLSILVVEKTYYFLMNIVYLSRLCGPLIGSALYWVLMVQNHIFLFPSYFRTFVPWATSSLPLAHSKLTENFHLRRAFPFWVIPLCGVDLFWTFVLTCDGCMGGLV